MRALVLSLALASAAFPAGAGALSNDREQPVRIDADRAQMDDRRRVATYEGNVVLVQGSLRITGDTLVMQFDESYDLATLVAEGKPAHFRQELDTGAVQQGWADRIEYRGGGGAMVFAGNARITQGEIEMAAHRIDYDPVNTSIEGVGAPEKPGEERVTIVLRSVPGDS